VTRNRHGWFCLAAWLALGMCCAPAAAQEQLPADDANLAFWDSKTRSRPAAAAQVAGMGNHPFTAFALRAEGHRLVVWDEVGFAEAFAPALNPNWLLDVRDRRRMPAVVARLKQEIPREDWAFYQAYSEALVRSFDTPLDAFKKSAEDNKTVTFAHLMSTPDRFRGKVIAVKGTLVMLRREDPSLLAQQNGGVKDVYVGWVFGPTPRSNPFCVQFPILPEGLEPAEKMRQEVTFFGYFLATFKYDGAPHDDKPTELVTPLLVGPTVVVGPKVTAPIEAATSLPLVALGVAVCFMFFLAVVFFVMHIVLQRGDRQVTATLERIKSRRAPANFSDEADPESPIGTAANPAPSQLVFDKSAVRLPEAKPVDPERN
jgi:hypothetical protein